MIMKAISYLRHIISKVRTKVAGRGVQFKSKGAGARGVDDIIFSPDVLYIFKYKTNNAGSFIRIYIYHCILPLFVANIILYLICK